MGYIPYLFLHCVEMLVQIIHHLSEDVFKFFRYDVLRMNNLLGRVCCRL